LLKHGFSSGGYSLAEVGRGTLILDQLPDAIRSVGLIRQHDCASVEAVEQGIDDLPVVSLSGG
jgi:hypothetical protein